MAFRSILRSILKFIYFKVCAKRYVRIELKSYSLIDFFKNHLDYMAYCRIQSCRLLLLYFEDGWNTLQVPLSSVKAICWPITDLSSKPTQCETSMRRYSLLYLIIITYQTVILQCLDRYATVPYSSLIIQDDRDQIKETKFRPISGYKLQLCLFAALTTERKSMS